MSTSDIETIILINEADRREGYFSFGTSNPAHNRKLLRRVGDGFAPKISKGPGGFVTWWQYRLPIKLLSSTFGIRKASPTRKVRGKPFRAKD